MWFYGYFNKLETSIATSFVRSCLERSAVLIFDLVLDFDDLYHTPEFMINDMNERTAWVNKAVEQTRSVLEVMKRCQTFGMVSQVPITVTDVFSL